MMAPNINVTGIIVFIAIVSGIVGWALIELVIWLFSFVHISFG